MRAAVATLLALLWAMPVTLSAAPESSLRPEAREAREAAAEPAEETGPVAITDRLSPDARPAARPEVFHAAIATKLYKRMTRLEPVPREEPLERFPGYDADIRAFAAASHQAVAEALRPIRRTKSLVQKAMARQRERRRGAVCGDPGIQGDVVGYVPGRLGPCGISNGVKVRSVSGVALSQEALIDCTTAKALKRWVDRGAKPAVGNVGGGIAELRVAAHYSCRTRNNQPGAKISEHGKGRAIDISAIRLRDGTNLTVLGGYRSDNQGPILRRMYRAACGIFGTTLGPDGDRFHQDHFHFDTARYRSGAYCH